MDQIKENIDAIFQNINDICKKTGRNFEDICVVAVTKTIDTERINFAIDCGLNHVGENKVQEVMDKYEKITKNVKWHLIGHLQSNKVKYIIDKVDMIHSLDSQSLAEEINKRAAQQDLVKDVLIQVNVANEETKFGIELEEVDAFISQLALLKHIRVKGLMTIAPNYDDVEQVRPVFRALKNKFDALSNAAIPNVEMKVLSMGMTNDYQVAIEEGATLVRIGTGIFGKRNYQI